MKAKITWFLFGLMALGLTGASKNCCGKNCRHGLAPAQEAAGFKEAAGHAPAAPASAAGGETNNETNSFSPVNLFIFQI